MALTTGTIHDVLARRNPTLDVKTKKGANTKDPGWEMVVHKDLRPVCCPKSINISRPRSSNLIRQRAVA